MHNYIMCMVSHDAQLKGTKILVVPNTKTGQQLTVYSNTVVNNSHNNAMVLPVPYPKTINFVDLSEYKHIFNDANRSFNHNEGMVLKSFSFNGKRSLSVVNVGSYQCSIAMNLDEIQLADKNVFDLSVGLSSVLKSHYSADHWGFIICKIKNGANEEYHPLGYTHKMYDNHLFVPTRHYHGSGIDKSIAGDWDHQIYLYNCDIPDDIQLSGLVTSKSCGINFDKCGFEPSALKRFRRISIEGYAKNTDIFTSVNV